MPDINPEAEFESVKQKALDAIRQQFPMSGKLNRLELVGLEAKDALHVDDVTSQYKKKVEGGTWSVPVRAQLKLVDVQTGKTLDSGTVTLAQIPKITRRYTYIVEGHERQHDSLFLLKPGIYHRVADNGDIQAKWNLQKGRNFDLLIDRATGRITMKIKTAEVPLYSVLKALNVADGDIEQALGRQVFEKNRERTSSKDLVKIPKTLSDGQDAKRTAAALHPDEAATKVRDLFAQTATTRPDGDTHSTLDVAFTSVTGPALLESAKRILQISRGEKEPDDRQSLGAKDIHGTAEFVERFITRAKMDVTRKIVARIDKSAKLTDLPVNNLYTSPINGTFRNAQFPEQHNPLGFLSGHLRTTIVGADYGGVKGEDVNLSEDKLINPSHIGFLDPVQTPESAVTGISLHLPIGARKKGKQLVTRVWDVKKKSFVEVAPQQLERAVVAYPDQVEWKNGQPSPREPEVVVYDKDRTTGRRKWAEVDYVLPSAKALFSFSANLVPFLSTNSGGRAMMAAKQQEQAIALKHREAPLVQTKTDGTATFQQLVGQFASHSSPVDGTVTKVEADAIFVKGADGTTKKVPIYDHFPLNGGKDMMHATPLVKPGDTVKKGQTLADTNYSKDGQFAVGTNLRVAYTPFHGLTFEDSIIISQSAAEKLTSEHLHENSVTLYPGMSLNKRLWQNYAMPEQTNPQRMGKLDEDGIIKQGQKVEHGDVLVAVLAETRHNPNDEAASISKKLIRPYDTRHSVLWEHDYPGVVAKVVRAGKTIRVYVRTEEPMTVGDKLTGRYGNKGIVGTILPDHEMPHDTDGKPVEVILGPAGVPSRMNVGQLLETTAAKIAKKTGQNYVVDNFQPGVDYTQKVKDDLKKHGLSDTEVLLDPKTKRPIGEILTGFQYLHKLHHQVDKKMTARSHGGAYDANGEPPSGSGIPGGGQTLDQLATYAMLAHGAYANLREAQTWKSDQDQADVWIALQQGRPLPDPKPNRSMGKLIGYMRAMGIHMEKKGDKYALAPLTDHQVKTFSNGAIDFPSKTLTAKGARTLEDVGGLFDPKKTGGMGGKYWTHIPLAERMPNPVFERAIQALTGIDKKTYEQITGGAAAPEAGKTGFQRIVHALEQVDVEKEIKTLDQQLPKLTGSRLDRAYRRMRYLKALTKLGVKPVDAYTTQNLPVLPPEMRRVMVGIDGSQTIDDLNVLYKSVGLLNEQVKKADPKLPPSEKQKLQADLYHSVRQLRITGLEMGQGTKERHHRGLMEMMEGTKTSFFQSSVMYRRQDLSGRSTIITAPHLGLDEVGVPQPIAFEMFKPFIVKELAQSHGKTPAEAKKLVDKKDKLALEVLHKVTADRPVLLKRDPALHKFSIMGFKVRVTDGKAIGLHPMVCAGFNADHDGDTMALYVPLGKEAVDEAHGMLPSKNLFSPTTGRIMPVPVQDGVLGLYHATKWGEKKNVKVTSRDEVLKLYKDGKLHISDVITLDGKETTPGRLLLAGELPKEMQNNDKLLHDKDFRIAKGTLNTFMSEIGKKHQQDYARVADAWKNHGNRIAYESGSSFSLHDFHDAKPMRDAILKKYEAEEKAVRASKLSDKEKNDKIVEIYSKAGQEIEEKGKAHYNNSDKNRLYDWIAAGARGDWNQFRQMTYGPLLVADPKNRAVPVPITKSYAEGLPISQYWTSMHGARKGAIDRSAGTAEPGALTKVIINTVIDHQISAEDCHTTKGAHLSLDDKDVHDRYLAQPVHITGGKDVPAGTLLTAPEITHLKAAKITQVVVRSPLHCAQSKGVCARCYGLNENGKLYHTGTNVGVIAGQALGEPVTQLAMRTFHTGGTVGSQKGTGYEADAFERVKQLFKVPEKLPGAATIAMKAGTITKVEADKARGGHVVHVEDHAHHVLADRPLLDHIKPGLKVEAGHALSQGPINPHHLLEATKNLNIVRKFMTDEALRYYPSGTRRRNVETVVKAMTNVTKIDHAPTDSHFARGQLAALSEVEHYNLEAKKKGHALIEHTPQLKSMEQVPLTYSEDWMARANYRYLKNTFEEGAAQAWSSDIYSSNVAGLAHGAEYGKKRPVPYAPPPPGIRK